MDKKDLELKDKDRGEDTSETKKQVKYKVLHNQIKIFSSAIEQLIILDPSNNEPNITILIDNLEVLVV